MVELDTEAHGVEAGLAEIADVALELAEVHFLRLEVFFLEVLGGFAEFGEAGLLEFAESG